MSMLVWDWYHLTYLGQISLTILKSPAAFTVQQYFLVISDWDYFVERKISHWENLHLDWLSASDTSLHVVHYENVRQNLELSLRQIADFVGLSVDENRLSCVLSNPGKTDSTKLVRLVFWLQIRPFMFMKLFTFWKPVKFSL